MKLRLEFSNGQSVEIPCTAEDFKTVVLTERFTHDKPRISSFSFVVECAYCAGPFETQNPFAKYDSESHRVLASLYKLPTIKPYKLKKR